MEASEREYIVLCGQVIGNPQDGYRVAYNFDGERFADRKKAMSHGWYLRESDDFNIGVLERGKLISLDWMDQPVDTDPAILAEIEQELYL